ncbi:tetratricopeptide repeat protein [Hyphococcus sp.]|jgi:DNA-binding winged helix-turn-helix (wHTH) protein|uniref:tetratricopeptide repeat protein n=1 Tax=Hyphococcus sp. TaxID=2038636 RepID=UPI003D14B8FF
MDSGFDSSRPFIVGGWRVDPAACGLMRDGETTNVEPKVMDLLTLLAGAPGKVFSRDEIDAALWPGVTVGEDTLARAVSKLRRALGDETASPSYVETIPKRGYRLIADVRSLEPETKQVAGWITRQHVVIAAAAILIALIALVSLIVMKPDASPRSPAASLTERANDLYMRFTRADNEAAITLYQRAIAADPNYAPAQAGLANSLVQRVIRWQSAPGDAPSAVTLQSALAEGVNETEEARALTARAVDMAERAVRLDPKNADALKALGFAYSARGDLDEARNAYMRAVAMDQDAWEVMINLGELDQIAGDERGALQWFESAYAAMDRIYAAEPQRIGPWRAPLGVVIGETYEKFGEPGEAEIWYRRVLDQAPLEPEATMRLARLLRQSGGEAEAAALCAGLNAKIGRFEDCLANGD